MNNVVMTDGNGNIIRIQEEQIPPLLIQTVREYEGKKYLRTIKPAVLGAGAPIEVDVYCVLKAFGVTSGPVGHAIKKLLCAGSRGKGDYLADLRGVLAAVNREIDQVLEDQNS